MDIFKRQLSRLAFTILVLLGGGAYASAASICPSTSNTSTDCGVLVTLGSGGALTLAHVTGATPYDGADDALVGVINNSGSAYTGSFQLTGSGNGGSIFGFDGDGICTFTHASYCSTAKTGYEGPLNTFFVNGAVQDTGIVNIMGLAAGESTYFSLEGSPQSIKVASSPEPTTNLLLAGGLLLLGFFSWRKGLLGRQ